jgi:hypothetical protein
VDRRDGSASAIREQHRDAIGAAHSACKPNGLTEQGVTLDMDQIGLGLAAVECVRNAAMYLRKEMDALGSDAERDPRACQVLLYVFW